jgi:hypothetical protein
VESTSPVCVLQDLQDTAFKRVAAAGNGDLFGKVFGMGSVSRFPSGVWIRDGYSVLSNIESVIRGC